MSARLSCAVVNAPFHSQAAPPTPSGDAPRATYVPNPNDCWSPELSPTHSLLRNGLTLLFKVIASDFVVHGRPPTTPHVVGANHDAIHTRQAGYAAPGIAWLAHPDDLVAIAAHHPYLNGFMRWCGAHIVRPGQSTAQCGAEILLRGKSLLVFPKGSTEQGPLGTDPNDPTCQPAKTGAALMVLLANRAATDPNTMLIGMFIDPHGTDQAWTNFLACIAVTVAVPLLAASAAMAVRTDWLAGVAAVPGTLAAGLAIYACNGFRRAPVRVEYLPSVALPMPSTGAGDESHLQKAGRAAINALAEEINPLWHASMTAGALPRHVNARIS